MTLRRSQQISSLCRLTDRRSLHPGKEGVLFTLGLALGLTGHRPFRYSRSCDSWGAIHSCSVFNMFNPYTDHPKAQVAQHQVRFVDLTAVCFKLQTVNNSRCQFSEEVC